MAPFNRKALIANPEQFSSNFLAKTCWFEKVRRWIALEHSVASTDCKFSSNEVYAVNFTRKLYANSARNSVKNSVQLQFSCPIYFYDLILSFG